MKKYRKLLYVAISCFFVFIVSGCSFKSPYVGRYISYNFPHGVYKGDPVYDSIKIENSGHGSVEIAYSLIPEGENTYKIKGEMTPQHHASNIISVDLYLLLINHGIVVDAHCVNAFSNAIGNKIVFSKTFTTKEDFKAMTFHYFYRYGS